MTNIGTKVAIYARYSSDRQSERSIEDQVRLCRERVERESGTMVEVFPDFALSGATRDRPSLNAMIARAGDFDIIMAEALDRLSHNQEDRWVLSSARDNGRLNRTAPLRDVAQDLEAALCQVDGEDVDVGHLLLLRLAPLNADPASYDADRGGIHPISSK